MRSAPQSLRRCLLCVSILALAVLPVEAAPSQADAERRFRGPDGDALPFGDHDEVRAFLAAADVLEVEELSSGTTRPRRVTLERDGVIARAVFRAVDVDRERLRTRDGEAYAAFYDRAIHEVAAYELARLLLIDMIPPTVERQLFGAVGTLQLWVEEAMTETERNRQKVQPPQNAPWRRQHQIMRVFDALVHNSDRNTGNRLIDSDWNLWMIDHTRTFQRPRGRTAFPRVTQLPAFLWESLRALDQTEVREKISRYVEPLQLASLFARHEALIIHIERLIEERGEAAVIVP